MKHTPPAQPRPVAVVATVASSPASRPAVAAAAQPKSGGTLRIGRVGDVTNLEAMRNNPSGFATSFTRYDRLVPGQRDSNAGEVFLGRRASTV